MISEIVDRFARAVSKGIIGPGDIAELRRLDPSAPDRPAFFRIMASIVSPDRQVSDEAETRWAILLSSLAHLAGLGHAKGRSLGRALVEAEYKEGRLLRLLRTDPDRIGPVLRRACRFLAAKGEPVDWRDLATLVLTTDPEKSEAIRRRIARDYYSILDKKEHTA